jgi:zinc protease
MRYLTCLILSVFLMSAPAAVAASEAGGFQGLAPHEYALDNGLRLLVVEDHKTPLAIFQIWYRVGAMDDPTGLGGISHVLEHMMFKGTPKFASKVLSQAVQKQGGSDNAFTSNDYTAYYQILPSDRIGMSVEFESDRMRNLILDPTETMSERDVVKEERRMRTEDDPESALYELVIGAAFNVHPYGRPVIGWMSDLDNITPEDLAAHYRANYAPNNAVIVVAGDVDPDAMYAMVREAFGAIEPSAAPRRMRYEEPAQRGERRVRLKKEAELPQVLAAFHAPNFPDPDAYALEVLAAVLSEGRSSRLFRTLVYGEKIALSAEAYYYGSSRDPFLFFLGATAAPGQEIGDVEAALYREAGRIAAEPPTEFEMQKALNMLEADFLMSLDSIDSQARLVGSFEMSGNWRMINQYMEGIRAVTAADVSRVAGTYLTEDNRTVGTLVPLPPGGAVEGAAE